MDRRWEKYEWIGFTAEALIKSVLNVHRTYIIIVHTYGQWNRLGSLMYHTQSKHFINKYNLLKNME